MLLLRNLWRLAVRVFVALATNIELAHQVILNRCCSCLICSLVSIVGCLALPLNDKTIIWLVGVYHCKFKVTYSAYTGTAAASRNSATLLLDHAWNEHDAILTEKLTELTSDGFVLDIFILLLLVITIFGNNPNLASYLGKLLVKV